MQRLPSFVLAGVFGLAVLAPVPARAQLAPFNGVGVAFAHVHLLVTDVEVHKKFWTEVMGGTFVTNGPLQMIRFPGVFKFEKALEYVVGEVSRIHKTGATVEEGLRQVNWGPYATWSMVERNGPVAFRRIYDELDGKLKN